MTSLSINSPKSDVSKGFSEMYGFVCKWRCNVTAVLCKCCQSSYNCSRLAMEMSVSRRYKCSSYEYTPKQHSQVDVKEFWTQGYLSSPDKLL